MVYRSVLDEKILCFARRAGQSRVWGRRHDAARNSSASAGAVECRLGGQTPPRNRPIPLLERSACFGEVDPSNAMNWHVQYRINAVDHIVMHPSPEKAIEVACSLIDCGCDVYGIGTGPLTDSIGRDQIARIYAFRARATFPLGGI
jgi:hypothetical protein